MSEIDIEQLYLLATRVWLFVETYKLHGSDETRRSFRLGDAEYIIHENGKGIGGALADLCAFLDEHAPDTDKEA